MTKEVRRALKAYARAVRLVDDMFDIPSPSPVTEYHCHEYSTEMEDMLIEQLLTSTDIAEERDAILVGAGLDHLVEDLHLKAEEWNI